MLSRVADSMLWMARYVERAENIARFVDVNLALTLDLGGSIPEQWAPLVSTMGDEAWFAKHHGEPRRDNVLHWLTFDSEYGHSILNCVAYARENARTVREHISTDMWEELNAFYLFVRERAADGVPPEDAHEFYAEVRRASQKFVGATDTTLSHGEAFHFARVGRLLERADKTSRILDVKYFLLLPKLSDVGSPLDIVQWSALLKSASALDMYRARHGRLVPSKVAAFLLLDEDFPRSVRHCVTYAEESLRAISGTAPRRYSNAAERRLGRLQSELDYTAIEDVLQEGLHEFVDRVQQRLNEVGQAIDSSVVTPGSSYESKPPAVQMQ